MGRIGSMEMFRTVRF